MLGLWIGFGMPYLPGFRDAGVSFAGLAILALAPGSSISAAAGYFYKSVFCNVEAMQIGALLIGLTAPHSWFGLGAAVGVRLLPGDFRFAGQAS